MWLEIAETRVATGALPREVRVEGIGLGIGDEMAHERAHSPPRRGNDPRRSVRADESGDAEERAVERSEETGNRVVPGQDCELVGRRLVALGPRDTIHEAHRESDRAGICDQARQLFTLARFGRMDGD
jgi:hypothetical protein